MDATNDIAEDKFSASYSGFNVMPDLRRILVDDSLQNGRGPGRRDVRFGSKVLRLDFFVRGETMVLGKHSNKRFLDQKLEC